MARHGEDEMNVGITLPLARDREILDLLIPRIREVLQRIPVPFLVFQADDGPGIAASAGEDSVDVPSLPGDPCHRRLAAAQPGRRHRFPRRDFDFGAAPAKESPVEQVVAAFRLLHQLKVVADRRHHFVVEILAQGGHVEVVAPLGARTHPPSGQSWSSRL